MLKTSIFTAPRLCRAPGFGPWIWCQSLVKESGYRIWYAQIEHSYIMVHKGNHPQMALIQVSEILSFTQTYPTIATIGSLNNNCSYSDPIGIFLGKWHNNCSDPLEIWMIYQCKSAKDPTQNLVLLIQKGEQSWFSTTHTYIYIHTVYTCTDMYVWYHMILYMMYMCMIIQMYICTYTYVLCVCIYIHIKKDICVYI